MGIGFRFLEVRSLISHTILGSRMGSFMKYVLTSLLFLTIISGCQEPYYPPIPASEIGSILIVEGYIDASAEQSVYTLGYGLPLAVDSIENAERQTTNTPVLNAFIVIASEDGVTYRSETPDAQGRYTIRHPKLPTNTRYRIHIQIGTDEYESSFVAVHTSPPITDLTWRLADEGVQFLVSTGDESDNSGYFRWSVEETWEYTAKYPSMYKFYNNTIIEREFNEMISNCYISAEVPYIHIASSEALATNQIVNHPVHYVSEHADKMGRRYSLLVRQFSMSKEAFTYWDIIKENAENLGDLFGPMPSEIKGNIKGVNNPDLKVVGFVEAGIPSEKRIFVERYELPNVWNWQPDQFYDDCAEREFEVEHAITFMANNPGFLLARGFSKNGNSPFNTHYTVVPTRCGDCRFRGGDFVAPSFWNE